MLIQSIRDTESFRRKLLSEEKQHITYVFYKNDICLYVGRTDTSPLKQFNYIMNHHTIKKIKTKFNDGYSIKIYFQNDIPYIPYDCYEGILIKILKPQINRRQEWTGGHFSNKYDIPYLDYMKPKEKSIKRRLETKHLFKIYIKKYHPDIYDDIYHDRFRQYNIDSIYTILIVCQFKHIYDAYKLIKKYRSTLSSKPFEHYTARKDKVYKRIICKLNEKNYINMDTYNKVLVKRYYVPPRMIWLYKQNKDKKYYRFDIDRKVDYERFKDIDDHYVY